MPDLERDGWRLWFEQAGTGPAVVLIHGLLMDHTMFDAQVSALSDRFGFVLPDLRGHGQSEHRAEEYTQWDLMEDHVALLDHLGIDRAVWGGVSQGGFQSLRAALRHPDRVAGLVLIDTQAGPEDETRGEMYEAFAGEIAANGWNDEIARVAAMPMFGASADPALVARWQERWRAQETRDAPEVLRVVTRRDDVTERLAEIQAPAVVIHGEEDFAIDMERAEALAAGLPAAGEVVRIARAGHSSTVEAPEALTEAIAAFLDGLEDW